MSRNNTGTLHTTSSGEPMDPLAISENDATTHQSVARNNNFVPAPENLRNESIPWVNDSMVWVADRLSGLFQSGLVKEAASATIQDPEQEKRTLTYPIEDVLGSLNRQIRQLPTTASPRDESPPSEADVLEGQIELCSRCAGLSLGCLPNPVDMPISSAAKIPGITSAPAGEDGAEDSENSDDGKDSRNQWYLWMEGAADTARAEELRLFLINEVADEGTLPCSRNAIQGNLVELGRFPDDFKTTNCPLCNALAAVRTRLQGSAHGHPEWPYELNAVSATYVNFQPLEPIAKGNNIGPLLAARKFQDTTILAVDPKAPHIYYPQYQGVSLSQHSGSSGYLYPVFMDDKGSRRFSGRQISPSSIDYGILKDWISACLEYHPNGCGNRSKQSAQDIPGFKVMDASTRETVPLPEGHGYAALSYVWGKQSDETGMPKVVEDAFEVTKNLGIQYLWVDRYCIDQKGEAQPDPHKRIEAQAQLASMHIIYEAAEFTIIAAAGQDADFGLPGVSTTPRFRQPSVTISDTLYVSSLPSLKDLLRHIKWRQRGWTFQEGILSPRRLIFTEYQVYFECNFSHCTEAVYAPDDIFFRYGTAFQCVDGAPAWPPMYGEVANSVRNFPMALSLDKGTTIFGLIEEYMKRSLSFNSDTLNGMLGILSRGATTDPPFGHFWGLPILTVSQAQGNSVISSPLPQTATVGLLQALDWKLKKPAQRNPRFPSWSWTGWKGPLELSFDRAEDVEPPSGKAIFEASSTVERLKSPYADIKIKVEAEDETGNWGMLDFEKFHDVYGPHINEPSLKTGRSLCLEGLSMTIRLKHGQMKHGTDSSGSILAGANVEEHYYFEAFANEEEVIYGVFTPDSVMDKDALLGSELEAIVFKHDGKSLSLESGESDSQIEVGYGTLNEMNINNVILMVLWHVGSEGAQDTHERLGTARIAIPEAKETSKARLKLRRRAFLVR
ncbi:tol protein [Colletotrichum truncatum]|uniref:Tol protein n=1 Tax=Colletotrichum truncatum TaxID=5467 RepID=A0ACC3ZBR4_COLTU|nr:tol protein [Colletotrichum truncatum]KAF6787834.1 tol protein [Colletotrichum truncatum]